MFDSGMTITMLVGIILFAVLFLWLWSTGKLDKVKPHLEWVGNNIETFLAFISAAAVGGTILLQRASPSNQEWANQQAAGLTLIVLALLAFGVVRDRRQRERLLEAIQLATEGLGNVKIYSSWNEQAVKDLISSARRSVLFVDTWFDEPVDLAWLAQAGLRIDIYVASKDHPFGSQRLKEIDEELFKRLMPQNDGDMTKCYAQLFDAGLASAQLYLNDTQVDLNIYAHRLMPALRLIIIDESKYIFSWFPLGTVSVNNVCFCLTTDSRAVRDQRAISLLKRQISFIANNSDPIPLVRAKGSDQKQSLPTGGS